MIAITKVISISSGPPGLSLFGQIQNLTNIIYVLSGCMFSTSIIKYSSSLINRRRIVVHNTLTIIFIMMIIVISILICFCYTIANKFLIGEENIYIIYCICISIPFYVLNMIYISTLNGLKRVKQLTRLNIIITMSCMVMSLLGMAVGGLRVMFVGFLCSPLLSSLLIYFIEHKDRPIKLFLSFKISFDKKICYQLLSLCIISFVSVISNSISMIFIRGYIVSNASIYESGLWQAIWSVSQTILLVVITSISTYALPKFSSTKNKLELQSEVNRVVILVFVISLTAFLTVYFFSDFIILLLFSDDFILIKELLPLQMFGNIVKSIGWCFGYVLVARSKVFIVTASEIIYVSLFIFITTILFNKFGYSSTIYSYVFSSIIHMIIVIISYKLTVK